MKMLMVLCSVLLISLLAMGACAKPAPAPTQPPPTSTPAPEAGAAWTRPADEMVMVYVPAGEFEMGSSEIGEWTQPVHTVGLDGFWIDRTEVTNVQYQRCVESGECGAPATEPECGVFTDAAKTGHPVVCIDWFSAETYCEWAGARLPTEAEWEYAARGPHGFRYPWGDDFNPTLVHALRDLGGTSEVGSYPDGASWCGALDMAGNVQEWLADWYAMDYYESSPSRNPMGPTIGELRVLRGGSSYGNPERVSGAYRSADSPVADALHEDGIRCAKDAD